MTRAREQGGLLNLHCQPTGHSREPPKLGVSHAGGCSKDSTEITSGGRHVGEAGGAARNDASSPLGLHWNTAWLHVNGSPRKQLPLTSYRGAGSQSQN